MTVCHPWKMTGEWAIPFPSRFSSASSTPRQGSNIKVGAEPGCFGRHTPQRTILLPRPLPDPSSLRKDQGMHSVWPSITPWGPRILLHSNPSLSTNAAGDQGLAPEYQDGVEQGLAAPHRTLCPTPGPWAPLSSPYPGLSLTHSSPLSLGPGRSIGLWPFRLTP